MFAKPQQLNQFLDLEKMPMTHLNYSPMFSLQISQMCVVEETSSVFPDQESTILHILVNDSFSIVCGSEGQPKSQYA